MLLLTLAIGSLNTLSVEGPTLPEVWRCHEEVYALASGGARLFAATSGGVLAEESGAWKSLGPDAPTGIRKLEYTSGTLVARSFDGRGFAYRNGKWTSLPATPPVGTNPVAPPPPDSGGTFLSAQAGDLYSFWNATSYYRRVGNGWTKAGDRPPVAGDYCLLKRGTELLAGTNDGLWSRTGLSWNKVELPSALPMSRIQGFASFKGQYLVGGINGLYLGKPGAWKMASTEPVRQILRDGDDAWVVYGSGAVDKLVPDLDRLYNDVLYEAVKRPWTSCVSLCGDDVLFGGQNTWVEKTANSLREHQGPGEAAGDVVTAIVGEGPLRWIATQKSGVHLVRSPNALRDWTFDAGSGLPDPWVTAMVRQNGSVIVGTSGGGLCLIDGKRVRPMASPTQKVRALELWKGRLVVGGMDGTWIADGKGWKALPTNAEETTSIVADDLLVVTTAAGIYFIKP